MDSVRNKPWILGLTGGIGSGKTAVSDELGRLGAAVIDTDVEAHRLCAAGGLAVAPIQAEFGPEAIGQNGAMDRDHMRALVFKDPSARQRLEAILHPLIRQAVLDQAMASAAPYCVVVVPLLVEKGGWDHLADWVAVVDCPPDHQVRRVKARNGWPDEQIQQVLAIQATRETRLAKADVVIDNSGTLEELLHRTQALHQRILAHVTQSNLPLHIRKD